MKKLLYALLCLAAVSVSGAECRKHNHAYVAATERGEPYLLKNSFTGYVVTFRYTNPSPTREPQVLLGMPAPVNKTGFSRRDFTSIVINGIDSRVLEPKKYEVFNTKESSGVDVYFNFNGIPMIQRFSVSDSSPLLTMTWLRGKGTPLRPINTMSIRFTIMPCASGQARDSYSREVVSKIQKYAAKPKIRWRKQKISARDGCLIFQDAKYQGSADSPHAGPVLLCPDWKSILSGMVMFGVHQDLYVNFELDPKAASWSFGMLESEKKRSNAEFSDFVKKQGLIP